MGNSRIPPSDDEKLNRRNSQRSEEGNVMPEIDQSVPHEDIRQVQDDKGHAEQRNQRRKLINESIKEDVEVEPLGSPEEVAAREKASTIDEFFQEERQRSGSTTEYVAMPSPTNDVEENITRERSPTERSRELQEPKLSLKEMENPLYEKDVEAEKKETDTEKKQSTMQSYNNPLYEPVQRERKPINFDKMKKHADDKMRAARESVKSFVNRAKAKANQLKNEIKDKINDEFRPKRK